MQYIIPLIHILQRNTKVIMHLLLLSKFIRVSPFNFKTGLTTNKIQIFSQKRNIWIYNKILFAFIIHFCYCWGFTLKVIYFHWTSAVTLFSNLRMLFWSEKVVIFCVKCFGNNIISLVLYKTLELNSLKYLLMAETV